MELMENLRAYPFMCGILAIALFLSKILSYFSCKLRSMGIRPRPAEIGPFSRGEFGAYLFNVFYFPLVAAFVDPEARGLPRLLFILAGYIELKISLFIMRKIDGY